MSKARSEELSVEEQVYNHLEYARRWYNPTELTEHIHHLIAINVQYLGCGDDKDEARERTLHVLRGLV